MLLALSDSITRSDYKLERAALALMGKDLKLCMKSIRVPKTDEQVKEQVKSARTFKYLFEEALRQLYSLFAGVSEQQLQAISNQPKQVILNFIGDSATAVEQADVNEDLEDASVRMENNPPLQMYN